MRCRGGNGLEVLKNPRSGSFNLADSAELPFLQQQTNALFYPL